MFNAEKIKKVLQEERYIKYDSVPELVYTGDLFKDDNNYYFK